MKKFCYFLLISLLIFSAFSFQNLYASSNPTCTNHLLLRPTMSERSRTVTCTKDGVINYYCRVCELFGKTSEETVEVSAYGHNWNDDHTCTRCNKNMNGHWFKKNGLNYRCIVCDVVLKLTSMSPDLPSRAGYRVSPYDNPPSASGVDVTFNETPYNENGSLMSVTATSTSYTAKNAMYHWGEAVSEDIAQSTYPPLYHGGKDILEGGSQSSSVSGSGATYHFSTASSGKYIFRVYVNGTMMGGARRYANGSSNDDAATPSKPGEIVIKHVNKDTGKEIVDPDYTKTTPKAKGDNPVFSLPVREDKYKNLGNVSYEIDKEGETPAPSDSQYVVKIPESSGDTTITFYYSAPSLKIKHVLENTGEEIIDQEYTKTVYMVNPNTLAFSLDVGNKYPILVLTGYSLDGVRTNLESNEQYIVNIPWTGSCREITFYYKYAEVNITVSVKHIDITTGKLMDGTSENIYQGDQIPTSVTSLNLNNYPTYQNVGVYMDGKYTKKTGTNSYQMAVDVSQINYSRTYCVIFYYSPKEGTVDTFKHEIMEAIPGELSPEEVAKIASNVRGNELYDVLNSIPTSENVYANVRVYNYLFRYSFNRITETGTSTVTFIQPYIVNGKTTNVTTTYEMPIMAQYYKLAYLEVYHVESATLVNKVLPGGSVTLHPTTNTMPTVIYEVPSSYVQGGVVNKTVTLPTLEIADMKYAKNVVGSTEYAFHEAGSELSVRNDKLMIDGKVVTDSEWRTNTTNTPNKITPSMMDANTLYQTGLTISDANSNGTYDSTGSVTYQKGKNINGTSSDKVTASVTPNSVVVHTPVVNNSSIQNEEAEKNNQKVGSTAVSGSGEQAKVLVLDKNFKVVIPNNGTHKNAKGYGTRVYNAFQGVDKTSFAQLKQIKFPFDVFYLKNNEKILIPKNTWYTVGTTETTFEFLLPVWVREGAYDENDNEYFVETRVVAENYHGDMQNVVSNEKMNGDINSYAATKRIFVEVVGRLYDFTITGTNDPSWKLLNDLKVSQQPIGQSGQNANSAYKYALKLGYSAAFDIKTKGTKSDSISMTPVDFWYVDKTTNAVQEVDLYYHSVTERFIKIKSEKDNSIINANINGSIRNVPASERKDSLRIWNNRYNYTIDNRIGTFSRITLPMALRMSYNGISDYLAQNFYGTTNAATFLSTLTKANVKEDDVINAIGHWYGEYRLPSSTLVVPKGEVANANSNFLKDGYIIVQFAINSNYQNWEYLSYDRPNGNTQWQKENATSTVTLPNGKTVTLNGTGNVIIYEAGLKANNDYESSGTH